MRKVFFSAIIFLYAYSVNGQFVYDYLKAAETYFDKGNYASAAEYYEKYLDKNNTGSRKEFNPYTPQNPTKKKAAAATSQEKAVYKLAECYRLLNYPAKAAPNYQLAMEANKDQFPLAQYHYAAMQRALAEYAEAEKGFMTFLDEYKTDDEYRKNAERELKNLQFIQAQLKKKDIKYYTLTKAPEQLNTKGANYAPVWLNASTLLFTSTREDSTIKAKGYTNRVYQAVYTEGIVGDITAADLPQGKNIQQGVVALTPDGSTMFLTRWSMNSKTETSSIFTSIKTDKGWTDPVKLDESVNVAGANSQQPFVTADGKYLVYASDRDGGQGGFDLWYAELTDGKPGTSTNLGPVINTLYDEEAPYYHEASGSLIFSTNGRIGMGGYDFFQSKGTFGNWSEPVNLGYPTNSIKDDIYFTSRGPAKNILEDVVLSSDRDAACCLELFSLRKIRPLRQISGRVVSCNPDKQFEGATVIITDTVTNKIIYSKEVGSDGTYSFTLEDYQPLTIKATAKEFIAGSLAFNSPTDPEEESLKNPDLCLVPEPPKVDEVFVVNNLYYEFDKATINPDSYAALDELIKMLETYPALTIEISAHTDSMGPDSYNQILSEARARNVVKYLLSKGIEESRLTWKGYGESMPVAPNTKPNGKDNPEGREKNRRTEFKILKN